MIQELTGYALKSTEKWEDWLLLVRNIEDLELKETEIIREDLLIKPITKEEIKSNSEDTDNEILLINYFILIMI